MNISSARDSLSTALGHRFFYGWVIVAVAGLGIFASGPGQSHMFSVFVGPISEDLGLSKAVIASAYGSATLVSAFLLPYMGALVDRHGPRRMMLWIVLLLGAACMLFGAAGGLLTLVLAFGLLRFLGQGSLMMNCANLVGQWFNRRRGLAASLMALGFAASMALHPPLALFLIQEIGWRQAWLVLGLLTWAVMLPPVLLLVYDKPEDRGLEPDGDAAIKRSDSPSHSIDGLSLTEALRTPTFYVLMAGWFGMSMLVTTLHFYQVTVLTGQGVAPELAASAFSISAVLMAAAMPLVGRSFDRFRTRYVFIAGLLVTAASITSVTFAHDVWTVLVYAGLFGVNNAFTLTMFGYLMPRYFGRRHLGRLQGAGQTVGVLGASVGPLPVGVALDVLGDPTMTLRLLALYPCLCAAAALLLLRTPRGVTYPPHLE